MKLESLYAIVAPIASPVAVATVTGSAVYVAMSSVPGIPPELVITGAVMFAVAVEMSGGLAFAVLSRAFANRSAGAVLAGFALAGLYLVIIMFAANIGAHGGILAATGVLPVVAYGGRAAWGYLAQVERARQAQQAERLAAQQSAAELERLRLQARMVESNNQAAIARANARAASAEHAPNVRAVRANMPNTPNSPNKLDAQRLELARQAYATNPNITARQMAAAIGVSSSDTGLRYLRAVEATTSDTQ